MVTDQEIVNGVENLLRQNAVTSINGVVQQLEAKLGLDLSHKAGLIRDHIELLLRSHLRSTPPQPPPNFFPQKDHFVLQHQQWRHSHPHQPQFPPHFVVPKPGELNFGYPIQQQYRNLNPNLNANPNPNPNQYLYRSQQGGVKADNGMAAVEMPKESAPTKPKRRGGPGGLNKVCRVSPELQAIVGEPAMPRTQIVKQLWAYIRKNNLQDPSNKRKIVCDEPLRLVFETDCTDMFKMNKLLAKHITSLEPNKDEPDSKRAKVDVESASESTEITECSTEVTEGSTEITEGSTGVTEGSTEAGSSTMVLSDALATFIGTEKREMLQSEAVRRVWEYISVNNLTDPQNPMTVICDPKLQELFGCESTSLLGMSEMLMSHFFKKS